MVELGGNIEIIGFEEIDPGKLIIVKKIIGNFAKKLAENPEFKKISLELVDKNKIRIKATLIEKKKKNVEAEDKNLFFALNKVLKSLNKKV